eukprot:CAMPEP_0119547574 /NCGR_PEP_ID=MMETSP1352-20130426/1657_1 /TAXON_ID=265584 /ORGANISM="Stauroneis constricta, Strain CCMP1120" /LENGTH=132 /DNA_ID=CAMNT_0007592523 /DNA_START=20 /DNA_END=414 /DNA_ORIENTATION=+
MAILSHANVVAAALKAEEEQQGQQQATMQMQMHSKRCIALYQMALQVAMHNRYVRISTVFVVIIKMNMAHVHQVIRSGAAGGGEGDSTEQWVGWMEEAVGTFNQICKALQWSPVNNTASAAAAFYGFGGGGT